MSDEEQDKKDEEFMKEIEEDAKKPVEEEELPEEDPLRWVAWMLANDTIMTLVWFALAFMVFILMLKGGAIGVILMIGYGAATGIQYWLWIRRLRNVKRIKAQSEQDNAITS